MPFLNLLSNQHFFAKFGYDIFLTFINEMTHFSDSFELNILIMDSVDHEFTFLLKIL